MLKTDIKFCSNNGDMQDFNLEKKAMKDKHATNYNEFRNFTYITQASADRSFVVLIISKLDFGK